ncbi:MAG TPA: L-threonylcarbamoyladenylate synthase [Bacillota bacterium]|nr:L-threonylcarbamoyladenylate synthase [Bacillota bacterium]
MKTIRWKINTGETDFHEAIEAAAAMLKEGKTVAFPTETVYGLGADATNPQAVDNIFRAKGRPQDNPLIAHVATIEQLKQLVTYIPPYAEKLIEAYSPGPITYVLKDNGTCAENVTAGLATVAVRIPDHPVALALLKKTGRPVAAPSANISGKPSPTTADHVWEDLQGKIAGLIDGGPTGVGVESTVIDCTGDVPVILRPGGITKEQLEEVAGTVVIDPGLTDQKEKPKSPGMKYRHYAPEIPLWLVEGGPSVLRKLMDEKRKAGLKVAVLASTMTCSQLEGDALYPLGEDLAEIAARLYEGLRTFKKGDYDLILCETFPEEGIGQAIMNRLRKAASNTLTAAD